MHPTSVAPSQSLTILDPTTSMQPTTLSPTTSQPTVNVSYPITRKGCSCLASSQTLTSLFLSAAYLPANYTRSNLHTKHRAANISAKHATDFNADNIQTYFKRKSGIQRNVVSSTAIIFLSSQQANLNILVSLHSLLPSQLHAFQPPYHAPRRQHLHQACNRLQCRQHPNLLQEE